MKITGFITFSMLAAMLGTTTSFAQQLPNAGFEGEWVDCQPFTSATSDPITIGQNPESWCISHVTGLSGLGKKELGSKSEGYNSTTAVALLSNQTGAFGIYRNVPAYVTLGTSWNTSQGMGTNTDGGSFGGIDFTYTPDGLQFYYKRTSTEPSTVLAYSWTGTCTQADVPAEISFGAPKTITMTDRDRCIIDYTLEGCQGGDVTKSDDAALVSLINTAITEDAADWTEFYHEFEYKADAKPSKFNIVIASGDYFSQNVAKDNSLIIDDVKLVYYSRLKSFSVNGTPVTLEDGKYDYTVESEIPDGAMLEAVALGKSATVKSAYDAASKKVTVTVSNVDADRDGKSEHVYTFTFGNAAGDENKSYSGFLTIDMNGTSLTPEPQAATIQIIPTGENTCSFLLPNFTLEGLGSLGDIKINTVTTTTDANGTTTYNGEEKDLQLMLMEIQPILADVNLDGTIDAQGNIDMNIHVIWKDGENGIPIEVKFFTKSTSSIDNVAADNESPAEYYTIGGIRVNNPVAGNIYIVRRGNTVTKELLK
ncbi:calycin-like domain-containing protein [uncultured Muribaculum sp.]|uniref:calycin-like domain-containing protein n=1 Tax=uncultured Muribaculum sp. TaxID=1918613 RepID=UPI0025D22D12|nr:calycin-like domain-containing protein [uncultured Muribaculum sp.]